MRFRGSLNIQIGDRGDRDGSLLRPVRDGQDVARRTAGAVSGADAKARPDQPRGGDAGIGIGTGGGGGSEGVVVQLSSDARKSLGGERGDTGERGSDDGAKPRKLTPEQQQVVRRLEARDTDVRAHEAAHQAAAKGLGGAASFSYDTGPDGKRYAVGGEVPVELKAGRTPEETISNAQTVRSAALAPADPSSQDLAVAAQATQMEAAARQEQVQRRSDDQKDAPRSGQGGDNDGGVDGKPAAGRQRDVTGSEHDPLKIFSALKAERSRDPGRSSHLRAGDGCGFCQGAAARYG